MFCFLKVIVNNKIQLTTKLFYHDLTARKELKWGFVLVLLDKVNLLIGLWKPFWIYPAAGSSQLFSADCNWILEEVTESMLSRFAKNEAFSFPENTF